MRATAALGRYGEDLAERFLVQSGFRVVARNWRCRHGELDIVAVEDRTLVVIEVKTRRGVAYGSPLEAVTAHKAARLRRLAGLWLAEHDQRERSVSFDAVRVDVVGILQPRRGSAQIEHVRGVA